MKNFSRFIGAVLVFAMLIGINPVFANKSGEDRVEIKFCVGDETLMINGNPVLVEKPYVVGDGVTLVPLRVITEAFGAEVEWEESTQTINLKYPDISIVLQIGNQIAEVNGKAETLLAAPELPTEYTMVPLRFISENFGADVSYDDVTEEITVVKDKTDNESILAGAIDNAKIGDSYYKWSIDNPTDMHMKRRDFDGTHTEFEGENGSFYIAIEGIEDDFDFEKMFVDNKASLQGTTLVKADKDVSNPNKRTMHFQAKIAGAFVNVRYIFTTNYAYIVSGSFDTENAAERDKYIKIMDTFDVKFENSDTYDLSNVKDGVRKYEDKDLKISFNVPQDYIQVGLMDAKNELCFVPIDENDTESSIIFDIYSKSEVGDAKTLANYDYSNNKIRINEEISTFSENVRERKYSSFSAYEYDYTVNHANVSVCTRDLFFEQGDYTYNVGIHSIKEKDLANSFFDSIVNSIVAEPIDPGEVGILIRNIPEATGTITVKMEDATIEVPNIYQVREGNPAILFNPINGIDMSFQKLSGKVSSFDELIKTMNSVEEYAIQNKHEIVSKKVDTIINTHKVATLVTKKTEDGQTYYSSQYAMYINHAGYVLIATYPEEGYSEASRNEVMEILKSIEVK